LAWLLHPSHSLQESHGTKEIIHVYASPLIHFAFDKGNKETKFLEDRKRFLQYFVEKISEIPNIWYSEENREFIRSNTGDFEKLMTNLPKPTTDDIINKYKTTFSFLAGVSK